MKNNAGVPEMVSLLQKLVRAGSEDPPGDTGKCAQVLVEALDGEGIPHKIEEPQPGVRSVVAVLEGKKPGPVFLFNGHIDTVPAGTGWSLDPFGAEIRDGYLYGRGSTDMKAGIAASLTALLGLKRAGAAFAGTVIFTAVGDEENHSQYGTKYLLSRGLKADFAVNCEPTNLDICLGNRGLLMMDVFVKGRSSHAGRPGLGKNAVTLATRIIEGLNGLDFSYSRDERFKDPLGSVSVVGIRGGGRINVIPDSCVVYLDRRMMPGETGDLAVKQIEEVITQVTGRPPGRNGKAPAKGALPGGAVSGDTSGEPEVLINPEIWHEPFWMGEDNPYVQRCVETYREVFGKPPVFEGKSAGTDASHLVSMGKIPTIIFGPGDYRVSHTIDEGVEISQLDGALRYYTALIKKLLN
ncbi:MAG: M20 family metallopeptidase [Spirochaetaceae bacterium]|jgi:acetylornithine deacetylase/succinyl-diaminopimelate desuccinylase family protein|nr:M20 family metallopeptidase [Spirochaetaceae bacterium]